MSTFESAAQPFGVPGHASAPPYPTASAPAPYPQPQPQPSPPTYQPQERPPVTAVPVVRPTEDPLSLPAKPATDAEEDDPSTGPDGSIGPTGRPKRHIPEPAMLEKHGPAKVLAICNQKGGVGKTTSTINLGAALTEFGRRVLLVDFDPQGALSVGLGIPAHQLDRTIYNVLIEHGPNLDEVVIRTTVEDMDLLPSNIDLSAAEVQLVAEVGREHALLRTLRPVIDKYDYILVDCQPSLGLLTVNALAAADGVLIPLECEYFSMRGAALLMDTIQKVQERLNPRLEITGILATMFDPRTLHSREVMARVVERFGDIVFDTVINRTVRFPETTVAGEPITRWAPRSAGAKAYRALAREVIAR
ncbi:ParA family protein [Kibdelosporangium philippinense]|uniref:ParA family protein n=1 Tax=Kibdelosporangium philippinense TaxID=211113 RepID=UPI001F278AF6